MNIHLEIMAQRATLVYSTFQTASFIHSLSSVLLNNFDDDPEGVLILFVDHLKQEIIDEAPNGRIGDQKDFDRPRRRTKSNEKFNWSVYKGL